MKSISRPGPTSLLSHIYRSIAVLFIVAGFQSTLVKPASVVNPGISNFGRINENYYRGGQPDIAGFDALKKIGVKTVIDLQKDGKREEPGWVQKAGLRYFNIPLSSHSPATTGQTQYFLKLVTDPANWPVYVHCAGGRHRTGEMTAIYRITHDSWTADQAYKEMKDYDYYAFGGHGSLKKYVYDYYEGFKRLLAAVPTGSSVKLASTPAAVNGN